MNILCRILQDFFRILLRPYSGNTAANLFLDSSFRARISCRFNHIIINLLITNVAGAGEICRGVLN
jgi:hypothetical protein